MPDDTHECPRNGCGRTVQADQLMCPQDWRSLPWPVRTAVWTAWDDGRGAGTAAHTAAIAAAIRIVNERNEPQ